MATKTATASRSRRRRTGVPVVTRANLGFRLAKASQRWNELLAEGFAAYDFPEVRPAYGSVLVPLFEQDGLRIGEIASRSRLSKQTMTTLVRRVIEADLVRREDDPDDGRAARIVLTPRGRELAPVAGKVIASIERKIRKQVDADQRRTLESALEALIAL
jgi:DNA-binding MarR family transcriptional regulator